MKKAGFLFFMITSLFFSEGCTKKEKTYTQQEMERIVDSIVEIQTKELNKQAKEDLELRLPIELKPILDSMRNQHSANFLPMPPSIDTSDAMQEYIFTTNDTDK